MARKDEALQKIESHEKLMQNNAKTNVMIKIHSIETARTYQKIRKYITNYFWWY